MVFSSLFRKILNGLFSVFVGLCLLLAGFWSVYALWDNNEVYSAARNTMSDLQTLKPTSIDEDGGGYTFEEILKINSDVCAWLTMDGTSIDYPVVQGETNLTYINKDVYGDFALAGSIFLDTRNSKDFSDPYSLIYGHHMDSSIMFGDLDLYRDQDFLDSNSTGELLLPDGSYDLEVIACISVESSDDMIFDPDDRDAENIFELLDYIENTALAVNETALESAYDVENLQLLGLATCASDYTDARTVVICRMIP